MWRRLCHFLLAIGIVVAATGCSSTLYAAEHTCTTSMSDFAVYTTKNIQNIHFFWKNAGEPIRTIANLDRIVRNNNRALVFATNGGIFGKDDRPLGLYVENGIERTNINHQNGPGNFFLKPNGIFFIDTNGKAGVLATAEYIARYAHHKMNIRYAVQSGPMLVINGAIHPAFRACSTHLKIRSGVGIGENGQVIFVISKVPVSFYSFGYYFQQIIGCRNALYLDGTISELYRHAADSINEYQQPFVSLIAEIQ